MSKDTNNAAVSTNMGSIGSENQDNFYLNGIYCRQEKESHISNKTDFENSGVFAVADGLEGQSFGGFASYKAMELLSKEVIDKGNNIDENIDGYISGVNQVLCEKSAETGMKIGAALVLLSINNGKARIYNVGDSRCYLFRDGVLKQLSKDHTLASELADMNVITEVQAENIAGNMLTQHLGVSEDEIIISVYKSEPVDIKQGDKFFLCSSAVTKVLSDREIELMLSENVSCKRISNDIVFSAVDKNSGENLTAMVVEIKKLKTESRFQDLLFAGTLAAAAAAGVVTGIIINNILG